MYRTRKILPTKTTAKMNTSYKGERIEEKINRIVNNKEPIKDGAPIIYTERKEGVKPEYDIRTDRWDVAIDAMDKVSATHIAKRDERHNPKEETKTESKDTETKNISGTEPTQTT